MSIEQEDKSIIILQDLDTYLYQCSLHALLQLRKIMHNDDALKLVDEHINLLKFNLNIKEKSFDKSLNLDLLFTKYNDLYDEAVLNDSPDLDYYSDMVSSIRKVKELIESEEN